MISKLHIKSINKIFYKNRVKYQIIYLGLHLQYTKSKLVSSEILYGYGRGGWIKRLVQFHEQGDDVCFRFHFGLTVLIMGGQRVELNWWWLHQNLAKRSRTSYFPPLASTLTDAAQHAPHPPDPPSVEADESALKD